jgi:hypothetical protein
LLETDEETVLNFNWNKNRRAFPRGTSCDEGCRKGLFCDVVATEEFEEYQCNGVTKKTAFLDHLEDSVFNALADPWILKSK